ncbi:hypothetical protein NDU88_002339 [Pleurodeles waltl]|uniref:Uncharacterized protein n=1 Tax=Pleurodeles waltl TaxID=8319 RepID=A0AAV7NGV2_PLEWA|nr:hypothetical protein NDU88_002339 [Pleurodeles waltl]
MQKVPSYSQPDVGRSQERGPRQRHLGWRRIPRTTADEANTDLSGQPQVTIPEDGMMQVQAQENHSQSSSTMLLTTEHGRRDESVMSADT